MVNDIHVMEQSNQDTFSISANVTMAFWVNECCQPTGICPGINNTANPLYKLEAERMATKTIQAGCSLCWREIVAIQPRATNVEIYSSKIANCHDSHVHNFRHLLTNSFS